MKFSANLGFLWTGLPLADAIHAAHKAGFDAVECHWPFDEPTDAVRAALAETGMRMLGINTRPGDRSAGDNGLTAIPGREIEARAAIDEAIDYARSFDVPNIHVMAGFGSGLECHQAFVSGLRYACSKAENQGARILIEPLNTHDAPGYFLTKTDQALQVMEDVGASNLKLMFDCYHVQIMEGDLSNRLEALLPHIGHIQFASVPDRGAPDHGEVNYAHIFEVLASLGYGAPLGAEYKPVGETEDSLDWMKRLL